MSHALAKSLSLGIILLAAVSTCILPSHADDKPAVNYNESGSVLATIDKHGHFYQVATDGRIYLLMCTKVKSIQLGQPECKVGDKPIAKGDTVHFRIEGDWVYMPPTSGEMEEKLRILTTELKIIPPIPAAPAATAPATPTKDNKTSAPEPAVVIGTGMHVKGQRGAGWSTTPNAAGPMIATASGATPVIPTGPVMATPVTGGAPVPVITAGPTTGGVVTGVPATGGAPITAIPIGPVTGVPVGGAPAAGAPMMMGGGGAPPWVHVMRIQTAGKIYQLECSKKPCSVANKDIALGDSLSLRVDKKHAYLSSSAQGTTGEGTTADQEYKILEVTDTASAPDAKAK